MTQQPREYKELDLLLYPSSGTVNAFCLYQRIHQVLNQPESNTDRVHLILQVWLEDVAYALGQHMKKT
tara:strand:+ start:380 stop:583 length:204 start_codon:yes stop_codon:yes gene_type:complete